MTTRPSEIRAWVVELDFMSLLLGLGFFQSKNKSPVGLTIPAARVSQQLKTATTSSHAHIRRGFSPQEEGTQFMYCFSAFRGDKFKPKPINRYKHARQWIAMQNQQDLTHRIGFLWHYICIQQFQSGSPRLMRYIYVSICKPFDRRVWYNWLHL